MTSVGTSITNICCSADAHAGPAVATARLLEKEGFVQEPPQTKRNRAGRLSLSGPQDAPGTGPGHGPLVLVCAHQSPSQGGVTPVGEPPITRRLRIHSNNGSLLRFECYFDRFSIPAIGTSDSSHEARSVLG